MTVERTPRVGGVTPKMVMIENDPGNTSGMFLYIFWMFLNFFLFDRKSGDHLWGSGGVGGPCHGYFPR